MMKTQTVRLIDVWLIGPLLLYAATRRQPSRPVRQLLAFTGAATILYNGANYLRRQAGELPVD